MKNTQVAMQTRHLLMAFLLASVRAGSVDSELVVIGRILLDSPPLPGFPASHRWGGLSGPRVEQKLVQNLYSAMVARYLRTPYLQSGPLAKMYL